MSDGLDGETLVTTDVFFKELFDEQEGSDTWLGEIWLWTLGIDGLKRTIRAVGADISELSLDADVYFHCAMHDIPDDVLARGGRGSSGTALAIPGVWMDLDYAEGKHESRKNYPPRARLLTFMLDGGVPIRPSCIVDSGGGFHAYWLFSELCDVGDDDKRVVGSSVVRGWSGYVQAKLKDDGFDCDDTWDLARVLRVPQTLNHKSSPPKRVRVVHWEPDVRYEVDQISEWAEQAPPSSAGATLSRSQLREVQLDGSLVFDPGAELDEAMIATFSSLSSEFAQTWGRKREKDFGSDQSRYEMALASILAGLGCSDKMILDALVQHRRESGIQVNKLGRSDYFLRTLKRARSQMSNERVEALDEIWEIASGQATASEDPSASEEIERAAKLRKISAVMLFDVDQIEREPSENGNGRYTFLSRGERFGPFTLQSVMMLTRFAQALLDRFGIRVATDKAAKAAWPDVVVIMRACCVEVLQENSKARELGQSILEEYMRLSPARTIERHDAWDRRPFIRLEDGRIYFALRNIQGWYRHTYGERVDQGWLRAAGCEYKSSLRVRDAEGDTRVMRAWQAPAGMDQWEAL